jgi:hypothetical protein
MNQLIDLGINSIVDNIFNKDIGANKINPNFDYDSSKFITESLPVEMRIRYSDDKNAVVDFIRFTADNTLCASIDREHVRLNFDSAIEKGSVIRVDSIKQSKPFYLIFSGYKGDVYTYRDAVLVEPGKSNYFTVDLDNPSLLFAALEGGCAYDDYQLSFENNLVYKKDNESKKLLSNKELAKLLADFKVRVSML